MTPPLIIGLDPGPKQTGFVEYGHRAQYPIHSCGTLPNDEILKWLKTRTPFGRTWVACERMAPQGQVGHEILDTVVWSGRYQQCATDMNYGFAFLYRQASICRNLLGSYKGNDTLIRRALIARFGESRLKSPVGKKVATHAWAALAVAVTFADLKDF